MPFLVAFALVSVLHASPDPQARADEARTAVTAAATDRRLITLRAHPIAPPRLDPRVLAARELSNTLRYPRTTQVARVEKNWWQRLWDRMWAAWSKLLRALFARAKIGPGIERSFGDVLIVVVILLVLGMTIRLVLSARGDRAKRDDVRALGLDRDARELYGRACQAAAAGERGVAAQLAFLAVIVALDLGGIVSDDASATVGDVRARLSQTQPALIPPYDRVARAFTTSAYAESPVDEPTWDAARRSCAQILGAPIG
ncbi:MAG: DUF4129 domain-containing protein [Vulcanimicrobiaceae bacterium]